MGINKCIKISVKFTPPKKNKFVASLCGDQDSLQVQALRSIPLFYLSIAHGEREREREKEEERERGIGRKR